MQNSNRPLILSPETFILHKGATTILYNRLTMAKLYCTVELGSLLTELQGQMSALHLLKKFQRVLQSFRAEDLVSKLIEGEFLRFVDSKENTSIESLWQKFGPSVPKNLRLLVTHKCNLACEYCQIERNLAPDNAQLSMSREIVDAAFNVFEEVSDPQGRTVIVTGGEPMLNLSVVKYVIECTRRRFNDARIVLFTNGWGANCNTASFMADHGVQVLVSLDGPISIKPARHRKSAQCAHNLAVDAYKKYKSAGCETGISAVAGAHNIELLDTEVISFFLNLKPASLGINFPHYLIGHDNSIMIPMPLYVDKLLAVYKIARSHGLFIEQISRILIPFVLCVPRVRECSAVGKGITIDASGKIGTCKVLMIANQLGTPITQIRGSFLEYEPFADWYTRSPFTLAECQRCCAIGVCGGGCAGDSWIKFGNHWQVDPRSCEFTKGLLNFFLWDLLEQHPDWLTSERPYYSPSPAEAAGTFPEYFANVKELAVSVGHQVR